MGLKAVSLTLRHWATEGTRSYSLLCLEVELFLWLYSQDIVLLARHNPGFLSVIKDCLSRPNQPITTEWSLIPKLAVLIIELWGLTTVEMFATVHITELPQFISPILEPQVLVVDALSQPRQGRSMYMFPPIPLSEQYLSETSHSEQRGYPDRPLVAISTVVSTSDLDVCDQPRFLPYCRDLLSQPCHILDGKSYYLHAWRLSCRTSK